MLDILSSKVEQLLPKTKIPVINDDQLLHSSFPYYLLAILMTVALVMGVDSGFILIYLTYTILPLVDEFFSLDIRNPTVEERKRLEKNDFIFKIALYITIILDWTIFFKTMTIFAEFEFSLSATYKMASYFFIFYNLNAIQFAVAHQIFHKLGSINKYIGTIHMIKNLYMHFTYQHLYGHHVKVATPEDPASAQKGISLYKFFPRTLIGSFKSVYKMENEIKPFYANYAVLSILASILFTSLIFKIYGIQAGIFFVANAFGSIFYLEAINYIQHYGLRRKKLSDGKYEKVTIRHSWNAPHRFSNYLLFKLQRHSDHHENSLKPYQTLVSLDDSPHLPHGYAVCIFMSFFPSVWFKVMDPLVDQYSVTQKGDINGDCMKTAVLETRKFIVKLGLFTTVFLGISLLLILI